MEGWKDGWSCLERNTNSAIFYFSCLFSLRLSPQNHSQSHLPRHSTSPHDISFIVILCNCLKERWHQFIYLTHLVSYLCFALFLLIALYLEDLAGLFWAGGLPLRKGKRLAARVLFSSMWVSPVRTPAFANHPQQCPWWSPLAVTVSFNLLTIPR